MHPAASKNPAVPHSDAEEAHASPGNTPCTLTVSIVTFAPDLPLLSECIASLNTAACVAIQQGILANASLDLIDNGPGNEWRERLLALSYDLRSRPDFLLPIQVRSGHGNRGFGAGHNMAIRDSAADFHLILNPDVILDAHAISVGLVFLKEHPQAGVVSPKAESAPGVRQYLCRIYPNLLDLFLRGFAPPFARRPFARRLAAAERRDACGESPALDMEIISGCFMLYRRELLQQLHGFCEDFFLYFEDFDLSLRTSRVARLAYVPGMRILHAGGNAGRKGLRHVRMFVASAWTFFNRHGWRLW
ncbi:MAG: glycosyltransferase family 2 protein [Thermodesulfobacteriota bacterium]